MTRLLTSTERAVYIAETPATPSDLDNLRAHDGVILTDPPFASPVTGRDNEPVTDPGCSDHWTNARA